MPRRKDFTKAQIINAMDKTKSVRAAARYLNCSYWHLKNWMKTYKDSETGKTLFEIHRNQSGAGISKFITNSTYFKKIEPNLRAILNGEIDPSSFNPEKLKYRMVEAGLMKEECGICGFHERRQIDNKIPLLLHFKDGNSSHWADNNVSLVCYNCFFLYIGQVFTAKDIEQLESHKSVNKTSEAPNLQLDPYHLKRLQDIGFNFNGEIDKDDPYSIVSYKT
jgi:hypothetical protein